MGSCHRGMTREKPTDGEIEEKKQEAKGKVQKSGGREIILKPAPV
jgi:hypothetical protein